MTERLIFTFNVIFFFFLFEKLTDRQVLICAVVWFHFLYAFSSLLDFKILKFMLLPCVKISNAHTYFEETGVGGIHRI